MDNFLQKHAEDRRQIDRTLNQLFEQHINKATDASVAELMTAIQQMIGRGGKRLRPLLTMLAYEGLGGTDHAKILNMAVAQELLHHFLLIHDDLIDHDTERYGGPNVTGYYLNKYQRAKLQTIRQLAESQALLAGDICFSLANEALLNSGFEPDLINQVNLLMQQTVQTVIAGQIGELRLSANHSVQTTKLQILKIYGAKTASYSFKNPMQTGAIMAGASPKQLHQIEAFAQPLGIAYQLYDDLQEFKAYFSLADWREGKYTLLIHHGVQLATPAARTIITRLLDSQHPTTAQARQAAKLLTDCGAYDKTVQTLKEQQKLALAKLSAIGFKSDVQQQLAELALGLTN